MKKVLSLLAILFALNAHSQVIEYSYSGFETVKGAGHEAALTYAGLMIYEPATTNITVVQWSTNRIYYVNTYASYHLVTLNGVNGRSFTALAGSGSSVDGNGDYHLSNDLIQGLNRNLKIATGVTVSFPAAFKGASNRSIRPYSVGEELLFVWTETYSFAARTVSDNDNVRSVDDIVAGVSAGLEARGYVRH